MTQLRKPAIWCPWAEVLCYSCHGSTFNGYGETIVMSDPEFAEYSALQPKQPEQGAGWCDRCGCEAWVPEPLDTLQRIRNKVGGQLDQTGGMCSALIVSDDIYGDAPHFFVTALDGPIVVGSYPNGQAVSDGEYDDYQCFGEDFKEPTPEDEAAAVRYIQDLMRMHAA